MDRYFKTNQHHTHTHTHAQWPDIPAEPNTVHQLWLYTPNRTMVWHRQTNRDLTNTMVCHHTSTSVCVCVCVCVRVCVCMFVYVCMFVRLWPLACHAYFVVEVGLCPLGSWLTHGKSGMCAQSPQYPICRCVLKPTPYKKDGLTSQHEPTPYSRERRIVIAKQILLPTRVPHGPLAFFASCKYPCRRCKHRSKTMGWHPDSNQSFTTTTL
jgi:hypothetical protein